MRTRRIAPPAFVRLFHATLVALALLALVPDASAAVPMCSEDGRSVVAPPILRPTSGRVLESPGDCERLRALLTHSNPGDDQRGGSIQGGDAPLRAVPARVTLPTAPCRVRLRIETDEHRARPAAVGDVFRPPRRS